MGKFTERFMDEMSRRQTARLNARLFQFAEQKASAMRAEGKSASDIAVYLGEMLGCPCCGPQWYQKVVAEAYQEQGLPLPPELVGVTI